MLFMVLNHLKEQGVETLSFGDLDRYMKNSDAPHFDYDMFNAAMGADPRLKNIVNNFTKEEITIATDNVDKLNKSQQGGDTVGQMASQATDLGATL